MNDEPIRIDTTRVKSLVEALMAGHPDEAALREAQELGAKPAVVLPEPYDEDQRVTVQLVHELVPEPVVIGDFPLEDAIERPQG